eukprot:6185887-Pleurochrysis_carterae.AAC.1
MHQDAECARGQKRQCRGLFIVTAAFKNLANGEQALLCVGWHISERAESLNVVRQEYALDLSTISARATHHAHSICTTSACLLLGGRRSLHQQRHERLERA